MNEDEFAELSAGHALGALSVADEQAYAAALEAHPEWADLADIDLSTAALLADGVAPAAPPLDARSRLLAAIAESPVPGAVPASDAAASARDTAEAADEPPVTSGPPTEVVQAVARRNWSRGVFALAASLALLVGLGWGVGSVSQLWQTPASVTALEQIEAAPDAASASVDFEGGTATAHWSEDLGKTVLVADGLPTLDDDHTFELWFVRADTPISAGTFDAADGDSTAELAGSMQPGDTIAVTVEPAGGAPEGTPTTAPIIAIPTA